MTLVKSNRQLTIDEAIQRDAAIDKQKKKVKEKRNQLTKIEPSDLPEKLDVVAAIKDKGNGVKQFLRIRTQFNAHEFDHPGEVNTDPSLTVPDQTMSILEILERHSRGLGISDGKVPLYSGGSDYLDGIDPRTLDIAEKYDILEAVQERYESRKRQLAEQSEQLKKKEFEDMVKQEVETRLKQKELPPSDND